LKLLLTSAGIKNATLHSALVAMLPKPISECNALAITTASYVNANGADRAFRFLNGTATTPMVELGWASVGVLELTALSSVGLDRWLPWVEEADVILVNGGDPLFLCYWMRESGFAALLPRYDEKVYVGLSAGSMVMAPNIGEDFVGWRPPSGSDETLSVVDFAIFPHLNHPMLPENTTAGAEAWAASMPIPCYALCDESAIAVIDGQIEILSEGEWHHFPGTEPGTSQKASI
jgi:dipeptidase E